MERIEGWLGCGSCGVCITLEDGNVVGWIGDRDHPGQVLAMSFRDVRSSPRPTIYLTLVYGRPEFSYASLSPYDFLILGILAKDIVV